MNQFIRVLGLISVIGLAFYSCNTPKPSKEKLENQLVQIEVPSSAHFRGIQAVSDDVVWLSGTGGTVLKTENAGEEWDDLTIPNCEMLDFRDIYALDQNKAWVMSSGNGVRIYFTENGGKDWNLQFEDTVKSVFFDGLDFSNPDHGIAYGDPVDGVLDVLVTNDGGMNWERVPTNKLPLAWEGEAGFAASGTGVVNHGDLIWIATGGGEVSRVLKSVDRGETWEAMVTPIVGGSGAGIFSMAFKDDLNGVVVGGDYVDSTSVKYNCAFTANGGDSWDLVDENGPRGYRSCVAITKNGTAIACGRTGIDKSSDFKTWEPVSDEGYFTCDVGGNMLWLAGRSGKVGRMSVAD